MKRMKLNGLRSVLKKEILQKDENFRKKYVELCKEGEIKMWKEKARIFCII